MSPLVLGGGGAASSTGAFPSASASVPVVDLPTTTSSTDPSAASNTSTLSAEELRVDEFDAGVIPSSILPPAVGGADTSAQPHLISARPRALSSTSDFGSEEEPSSPLGLMRAVDLPDLGEPAEPNLPSKKAKTTDEEFDELPTGAEKMVVIPLSSAPIEGRKVVFESAKTEEGDGKGEGEGEGGKEAERERRSASPTPDPGKIVAAKMEQGEEMKVEVPGEGEGKGVRPLL